jgi:hypothetical protein
MVSRSTICRGAITQQRREQEAIRFGCQQFAALANYHHYGCYGNWCQEGKKGEQDRGSLAFLPIPCNYCVRIFRHPCFLHDSGTATILVMGRHETRGEKLLPRVVDLGTSAPPFFSRGFPTACQINWLLPILYPYLCTPPF